MHQNDVDESNEHADQDRNGNNPLARHDVSEEISKRAASNSISDCFPVVLDILRERVVVRDAVREHFVSSVLFASRDDA